MIDFKKGSGEYKNGARSMVQWARHTAQGNTQREAFDPDQGLGEPGLSPVTRLS
jgi:hypothetical protein